MASKWQSWPVEFKGGLVKNLTPLEQGMRALGSATTLKNYEPTKFGGYRRVKGFQKFNDTELTGSGNITGLVPVSATTVLASRVDSTTKWYAVDSTSITLKATATGVGKRAQFATADFTGTRKTVIVDGVNTPAIYDHTAQTVTYLSAAGGSDADYDTSSSVEIFKQAAFYGNGHFLVYTAPSTIDDFDTGNGAGTINVGDTIVGLKTFRDQLLVFCERKVLRITGSSASDYQVIPISEDLGCIDGQTIQEFGGDIVYLAPDGVRLISTTDRIGDFGLNILSNKVTESFETFLGSNSVFSSIVQREKAQYRIFGFNASRTAQDSRGFCVVKKDDQGAGDVEWAELSGFKANVCASAYQAGATAEQFYFAGSDGYVYSMDDGNTFDGTVIESIYESPFYPVDDPLVRKTIYRISSYIEPDGPFQVNMDVKWDYNKYIGNAPINPPTDAIESTGQISIYGTAIYGTDVYGGNVDKVYRNNTRGSGFAFAIRLSDSTSTSSYTLDSLVIEYAKWARK